MTLLALRNLLRNRRRSIATLLALALGSAAILVFGGFNANIRVSMLTGYVRAGGHLQIQHRDFFLYGNGNPTAYGIADYQRLLQAVRADPLLRTMVTVSSPMLLLGGIAGNQEVSRTVVGSGVVAFVTLSLGDAVTLEEAHGLGGATRHRIRDEVPGVVDAFVETRP